MSSRSASTRITLVVLVAALAACGGGATVVMDAVDAPTAGTLIARPGTILLDIRTPEEFAEAHIDGALNIDFYATDFAARLGDLDREAPYVVYCRSGNRTAQAMDTFHDLGFAEVHEIDGGILAWLGAGLPATSG